MKEFTTLSPSKLVAARNVCNHNLSSVNIAWVKGPTKPSPVSAVTGPRQSKGQRATMRNEPNFRLFPLDATPSASAQPLPPPIHPYPTSAAPRDPPQSLAESTPYRTPRPPKCRHSHPAVRPTTASPSATHRRALDPDAENARREFGRLPQRRLCPPGSPSPPACCDRSPSRSYRHRAVCRWVRQPAPPAT